MMRKKRLVLTPERKAAKIAAQVKADRAKPKPRRVAVHTQSGFMNEVEVANFLGRAVSTMRNRRSLGKLPKFEKHGRSVYYRVEDVESFQQSERRSGTIVSE
jgi:predicted DNA-binding transcriptional regulator AlpA